MLASGLQGLGASGPQGFVAPWPQSLKVSWLQVFRASGHQDLMASWHGGLRVEGLGAQGFQSHRGLCFRALRLRPRGFRASGRRDGKASEFQVLKISRSHCLRAHQFGLPEPIETCSEFIRFGFKHLALAEGKFLENATLTKPIGTCLNLRGSYSVPGPKNNQLLGTHWNLLGIYLVSGTWMAAAKRSFLKLSESIGTLNKATYFQRSLIQKCPPRLQFILPNRSTGASPEDRPVKQVQPSLAPL